VQPGECVHPWRIVGLRLSAELSGVRARPTAAITRLSGPNPARVVSESGGVVSRHGHSFHANAIRRLRSCQPVSDGTPPGTWHAPTAGVLRRPSQGGDGPHTWPAVHRRCSRARRMPSSQDRLEGELDLVRTPWPARRIPSGPAAACAGFRSGFAGATAAGRGGLSGRRSRRCCPPARWLCRTPRATADCGPAGGARLFQDQ
jgi:hypothetical protein